VAICPASFFNCGKSEKDELAPLVGSGAAVEGGAVSGRDRRWGGGAVAQAVVTMSAASEKNRRLALTPDWMPGGGSSFDRAIAG
jgi:hypothetical protein